jgi:hypothetical protein
MRMDEKTKAQVTKRWKEFGLEWSVAGLSASKRALEPILSPEGEKGWAPTSMLTPGFSAEGVGHPPEVEAREYASLSCAESLRG